MAPENSSPGPPPTFHLFLLLLVDVASPLLLGHLNPQRLPKHRGSHLCEMELPATDNEAKKFQGERG